MARFIDLAIGPGRESEPLDVLERVFREHRRRFSSGDWAVEMFENGIDRSELDDRDPVVSGCPALF